MFNHDDDVDKEKAGQKPDEGGPDAGQYNNNDLPIPGENGDAVGNSEQ